MGSWERHLAGVLRCWLPDPTGAPPPSHGRRALSRHESSPARAVLVLPLFSAVHDYTLALFQFVGYALSLEGALPTTHHW